MASELRNFTVHIDTGRWSETVVDSVDLLVPDGRITALLGESGCGKSMVAAALTGTLPESAHVKGQVRVGATVGYVPQQGVTAFDPAVSVGDRLHDLELRHKRCTVAEAAAAAQYPVAEVGSLYPHQHSGGQIQRAALAAAFLTAPDLLVVDEPTASLDLGTAYQVWHSLRRYADTGAAVLVITHDVSILVATRVANHMSIMREGRIVAADTVSRVSTSRDPYVQGFFRAFGE
ncbi:ATP-binding cassette domain-containing protein [Rhodococcus sp. NPDC058521]|uniref:ATP-binding cassette domain-containing protein n=1 Tax=Rhodococcus sp. NPDC058521 TaxID=3346536 RepID=UPI00365FD322